MQSDVNVLVVFYSRYGSAERLALAAGVGAIQARGNIRLRRVADLASPAAIEADPDWKAGLARMNRDYVAPRPADPTWADVIVLAAPGGSTAEIEAYCAALGAGGSTAGRIAAPLVPGRHEAALRSMYAAAACAGLIVAPAPEASQDEAAAAREYGRRVTEMARSLKPLRRG